MTAVELEDRVRDLRSEIDSLLVRLDVAGKRARIAELEEQSSDPEFWQDPSAAQAVMQELSELREEVEPWESLDRQASDLEELLALADDEEILQDLIREVDRLESRVEDMRLALMFGGQHDRSDAIVAIHAGAGGTESQDWVSMLLRMYLRWAENAGFKTEMLDVSEGEEAGLKSVTFQVSGRNAYGLLKAERGVHRLVRLSPFDAAHRRHTSFALVEVMPDIEREVEVQINPDDLRVDVFRSAGAGGQNVQKNATAIRITHLPTGLVVSCQNERSQAQNRETAMKVLRARLYDMEMRKQEEELARLKGEHVDAGWGNQIRSYVLHPYQMVKDHRTDEETGDAVGVLEGDLDRFIQAYLRASVGET
ncbi:MAG: peptide chain release factor 2 [Anaerolineae bacterium]|nr:peptide chain release factor 2 [Anaerolineae bacterium]